MRLRYAALVGAVALAGLAGCAGQESTDAQAAGAAAASAPATSGRPATGSPTRLAGAHVIDGGCGGTPLLRGEKPNWTAGAVIRSLSMPYALSDDGNVAAFVFGHPLQAPEPEYYNNKILWVVRLPRDGQPLRITGHPLGADGPTFRVTQPANSGPGEIYPSLVTAPEPGCWRLTLRWNGHVDTIELRYVAERKQRSPEW